VTARPNSRQPLPAEDELGDLRARLESLERERIEEIARTNAAVAAAQDKSYWLERWHLDLNALMRRRGARQARLALRGIRGVYRIAYDLRSRMRLMPGRWAQARRAVASEGALAGAYRPLAGQAEFLAGALERAGVGAPAGGTWLAVGEGSGPLLAELTAAVPAAGTRVVEEGFPLRHTDTTFDLALVRWELASEEAARAGLAELHRVLRAGALLVVHQEAEAGPAPAAEWLLERGGREWRVALFAAGATGNPDLYVLERQ
jgi:SAM-dependent methyltransferase